MLISINLIETDSDKNPSEKIYELVDSELGTHKITIQNNKRDSEELAVIKFYSERNLDVVSNIFLLMKFLQIEPKQYFQWFKVTHFHAVTPYLSEIDKLLLLL